MIGYIPLLKTWSFGTIKDTATRESETFGYADGGSTLNPKHEIRNPKQYRMIKTSLWRYKLQTITPAVKYPTVVIPAKAGIQKTLDAPG